MASNLTPGFHVMSDLLTVREKGILFALLEPQCKLIKSTVAQVLVDKDTQDESPGWSCLGCGSMCLIEDKSIHTHFLRLYCVKRAKLLWEHELYIPFKYTATSMFFHTFPADGHHVGLNFAEETEAEEFHLAVKAAQKKREKMTRMSERTNAKNKSTSDPPDSGIKPLDHLDKEQHFHMDAPSTPSPSSPPVTLTTSSEFKDLNPPKRTMLMRSRLDEKDLKDNDIAEAVDCIINQFGLKAVQRELRSRGPVSQTFPRAAGGSISLALRKGPLPPVPSVKGSRASQQTPLCTDTLHQIQIPPCPPAPPPPPPPAPAPVLPERIKKSVTFKPVGSSAVAETSDLMLTSLREVFRQKQLLQQRSSTDGSQM